MSTPAASPSSMSRYLVGGAMVLLLAAGFAMVIFAIVASSWGVALSVAVWLAVTVWAARRMSSARPSLSPTHRVLASVGAVLQAVAGFYVAFSFLLAPPWVVAVLAAAWVATTVWAVRNWTTYRFAMLIAVAAMAVFWTVVLLIGDAFFDFGA